MTAQTQRSSPRGSGEIVNAMTIDVEDYFQVSAFDGVIPRESWQVTESRVARSTERLLAIFDDARIKATFFVLGWVAERFPGLVRTIADLGHEVASHGYAHRLIYTQTPQEFRDDVRRAKGLLEDASAQRVHGYRAPSFSVTTRTLWALDVLIEEGYTYDASVFPIHHDRYGIPAAPRHPFVITTRSGRLVEAPGSTVRFARMNLPVGGGGYFRLLPYKWTQFGIARINRVEKRPAIFYLHPWELDPSQPRLRAGRLSHFRHYRNLHKTEERLIRLLDDFPFGPLRSVLENARPLAEAPAFARPLPYLS